MSSCKSYVKVSGSYVEVQYPCIKVGGSYLTNCMDLYKKVAGSYQEIFKRQIAWGSGGSRDASPSYQCWVSVPDWFAGTITWALWYQSSGALISSGTPSQNATSLVDSGGTTRYADAGHWIVMTPLVNTSGYTRPLVLGFKTTGRGDRAQVTLY